MAISGTIVASLQAITPTHFENVVYDLVTASGLRNAVWRTPGADVGRDIEGEMVTVDFSGYHITSKWYVECKRYASSVDWPTVWQKVSYADSHDADYLLMVTTSALSPQCKSEVSSWNVKRRRPAIRFWDETNLEQLLIHFPSILVKHGLITDTKLAPASFMSLAQQTSKVVQAAHGHSDIANQANVAIDAAAALSELLTVRIRDAETGGKFALSPFVAKMDGYDWLVSSGDIGDLDSFDRHGLRAVIAVLRHVTGVKSITAILKAGTMRIALPIGHLPSATALTFLTEVALWADLELRIEGQDFVVSGRTQ